jgi:hypothetical protein
MAAAVVARTTGGPVNTPEDPVFFSQTDPLVMATPFLLWQPAAAAGGIAQVKLSQQTLMSHFIGRCDRDGADAPTLLAFNTRSPLDLAFEGAFWSRILTEYVASGLLSASFSDLPSFCLALSQLGVNTPANLLILAPDIRVGEEFSTPGVAAVPGRAAARGQRRAVPAIPAVPAAPGPAELEVLNLLTIESLREPGTSSPLLALAKLMAVLGGVLTRASRTPPLCLAKMTMALLRPNLERRIFGSAGGASDAAVAFHLKTFLLDVNLPPMFASRSARPADALKDFSDAIRYSFGTDEDRTAVETARLASANGCAAPTLTAPSRYRAMLLARQTAPGS